MDKICELCNQDKAEHIHHINRDRENNSRSNIQYLCKDCHRIIHYGFMSAIKKEEIVFIDFVSKYRLKQKYRNKRMITWLKTHFRFNEIINKKYILISKKFKELIFAIIAEEIILKIPIKNDKKINDFLYYHTNGFYEYPEYSFNIRNNINYGKSF